MTESPNGFTRFALVNDFVLERGFVSDLFTEDEEGKQLGPERMIELEQPLVLIVSDRITEVSEIVPVMELVKETKRPLIVFCEDMQDGPLSTMVYNNRKNIIESCAVNVPFLAGVEKENLKDIAAMTGATLVDNERFGLMLENLELKHLGSANNVRVDAEFTHIVGGSHTEEALQTRIEEIKRTIEREDSIHIKGVHKERLARMTSKIAEIQIGGGTDVERGEERDLIVDALNSARSALEHGILPGGGTALYQASKLLESGLPHLVGNDKSEQIGVRVLQHALQQPIRRLIENKTALNSTTILRKLDSMYDEGELLAGWDVEKEKLIDDMVTHGIVDSFKVV